MLQTETGFTLVSKRQVSLHGMEYGLGILTTAPPAVLQGFLLCPENTALVSIACI